MRFFLMGFMGSGKSTVGRKLAKRLNLNFIDLDKYIESEMNSSITELFNLGESSFRKTESECLARVIEENPKVLVALGGGTPCHNNNLDLILASGTAIYLQLGSKELYSRLSMDRGKRPLIAELNDEELLRYIEETLATREKYYNKAYLVQNALSLKGKGFEKLLEKVQASIT